MHVFIDFKGHTIFHIFSVTEVTGQPVFQNLPQSNNVIKTEIQYLQGLFS